MANEMTTITQDGEIVPTGGLPAEYASQQQSLAVELARAEVDQQITTARAYPRSITKAVQNITSLATLDEQSAEECVYALPRGGKPITGPSVRLAEIIASQWGNSRVGARVVHVDRKEMFVEAEGVFHDLESNTATTARVRRRISDKKGRLLSDDMIVVTGNAACSIAKRNAILGGVPKGVWRKAYDQVEAVLSGDVQTLAERKERAFKAFAAFGVTPEMLCASLGIGGPDDITVEHIGVLTGMRSALKNGEETVETMFPRAPSGNAGERPTKADAMDKLAQGGGAPKVTSGAPKQDAGKAEAKKLEAKKEEPKPAEAQQPDPDDQGDQGDHGGAADEDQREPSPDEERDPPEEGEEASDEEELRQLIAEIGETPRGIDAGDVSQVYNFRQGMLAAERGVGRKAIPGALRADNLAAEAAAWQLGHDLATARKRQGREG